MSNFDNSLYMTSITNKIIAQIVHEQDKYTMQIIQDYVDKQRKRGEFINAQIIPEGKLRHIINLGLAVYTEQKQLKLSPNSIFSEVSYVEYLRHENEQLRHVISELRESECKNEE